MNAHRGVELTVYNRILAVSYHESLVEKHLY